MSILMERAIIQGIKRLRVLTPYDYDNMDELVRDLSTALEESAYNRTSPNKTKKGRTWKRRSKSTGSVITLGSSLPKSTVSEDSESSLEGRIKWLVDSTQAQSDSDDLPSRYQYHHLTTWRQTQPVESDSVNENFLPSIEQKRKRKFKRMAIDIDPTEICTESTSKDINFALQKTRKLKNTNPLKLKPNSTSQIVSKSKQAFGKRAYLEIDTSKLSGKRKRSMRERSVECIAYEDRSNFTIGRRIVVTSSHPSSSGWINENNMMDLDAADANKGPIEGGSSSLSSSESDGGVITNDEGREGDDEHSDFFHESGGVWWDEDSDFTDAILSGTFPYVTDSTKDSLAQKAGREIRAGRRRLGKTTSLIPLVSLVNEKVSKLQLEPDEPKLEANTSKTTLGNIKRRRKIPPVGPVTQGTFGEEHYLAIPFANSLGHFCRSTLGHEQRTRMVNLFQAPPPPPPSPQPNLDSGASQQTIDPSHESTTGLINLDFSGLILPDRYE